MYGLKQRSTTPHNSVSPHLSPARCDGQPASADPPRAPSVGQAVALECTATVAQSRGVMGRAAARRAGRRSAMRPRSAPTPQPGAASAMTATCGGVVALLAALPAGRDESGIGTASMQRDGRRHGRGAWSDAGCSGRQSCGDTARGAKGTLPVKAETSPGMEVESPGYTIWIGSSGSATR
jgi:hypothetical protein